MTTTGAPWVLLRGLTREARHWGDFPAQLAAAVARPVITLDLPGNGQFNALASPTNVRGMTDFVRTQLQTMGHAPPYQLLAMSLGGMVATDWAQTWPQEVARLVLINTSMRPHSRLTQRLRPPAPPCFCHPPATNWCTPIAPPVWPPPGKSPTTHTPGPVTTCRMTTRAGWCSG